MRASWPSSTRSPSGHVDGHAPLLRGLPLNGYLAAGIRTDHECTLLEEAREKLAKGMIVLMREGSIAKNVTALAPLLTDLTWPRIAFCTDDRNPLEIVEEGHIDAAMRLAIAAGAPPIAVYRSASLGAAMAFGLADRGIVAAGYRADLVLLDDLERVAVAQVICGGRLVEPELFAGRIHPARRRLRLGPASAGHARRTRAGRRVAATTPVIGARPFSLITDHLTLACDAPDVLRLAVLERHGRNGNIGRGFVTGFGPLRGAIASSIGHDSHNLIVAGDSEADMARGRQPPDRAAGRGGRRSGRACAGRSAAAGGRADERPRLRLRRGPAAAACARPPRACGCTMAEPLLQLAFLPLPVIPHLKLTDRGYVAAGPDGLRLLAVLGGQLVGERLAARQHDGLHQTAGIVVPDRAGAPLGRRHGEAPRRDSPGPGR